MRLRSLLCCSLALVAAACAEPEPEMDDAATVTDEGIVVADLTGVWEGRSMPTTGDSVLGTWRFEAPADTGAWAVTFADGPRVPIRIIAVAGDSIVSEMGPYESSATGGMVNTRTVGRLEGDRFVGTFESRPVSAPDSVFRGRFEGTRVP